MLVTVEAFIGILFASMSGAVLVAKVSRIQSYAQVVFSDPMVIRYGQGALHHEDVMSEGDDSTTASAEMEHIPCPILEFRLINRLSNTPGGEIIDATINIVASIDANQACPSIKKAAGRRRRGKKGKKVGPRRGAGPVRRKSHVPLIPEDRPASEIKRSNSTTSVESLVDVLTTQPPPHRRHQNFDEDPTGHLVPRRIFSKLEVDTPDHPYFKRVWTIRHTLDENSPLLKSHARQSVKRNSGYWPPELNNHAGVRAAILFDQILVSVSGTSNADANSVYAQKVYDFANVNVGYRFVNVLYRDRNDGSLHVDSRLLNDVTEQAGGGGEPIRTGGDVVMGLPDDMDIL